jgi:hypothetical protein
MRRGFPKVLYCHLNASALTMTYRRACIKRWYPQTCLGIFLAMTVVFIA